MLQRLKNERVMPVGKARSDSEMKAIGFLEEGNDAAFYKSYDWVKCREKALRNGHYECAVAKNKGYYVPANVVHHVIHALAAPTLALDQNNLVCLCRDCHEKIHGRLIEQLNEERW